MKSKSFSILAALTLVVLEAAAARAGIVLNPAPGTGQYDLLPNGGFETGTMADWPDQLPNGNAGLGEFVASTAMPFAGNFSAQAVPTVSFSGPGFAEITDPLPVTVGETYVLSAFFNTSDLTSGNLYVDTAGWGVNLQILPQTGLSGWQFLWADFTAPISTARFRLVRDGAVETGQYGYIDDVALTPVQDFVAPSAVPEPGTLQMFATAFCAVVGITVSGRTRRLMFS